jgi:hypothetical protein
VPLLVPDDPKNAVFNRIFPGRISSNNRPGTLDKRGETFATSVASHQHALGSIAPMKVILRWLGDIKVQRLNPSCCYFVGNTNRFSFGVTVSFGWTVHGSTSWLS